MKIKEIIENFWKSKYEKPEQITQAVKRLYKRGVTSLQLVYSSSRNSNYEFYRLYDRDGRYRGAIPLYQGDGDSPIWISDFWNWGWRDPVPKYKEEEDYSSSSDDYSEEEEEDYYSSDEE
jgi:hypothetical protein